jgi:hypothetical protein
MCLPQAAGEVLGEAAAMMSGLTRGLSGFFRR